MEATRPSWLAGFVHSVGSTGSCWANPTSDWAAITQERERVAFPIEIGQYLGFFEICSEAFGRREERETLDAQWFSGTTSTNFNALDTERVVVRVVVNLTQPDKPLLTVQGLPVREALGALAVKVFEMDASQAAKTISPIQHIYSFECFKML